MLRLPVQVQVQVQVQVPMQPESPVLRRQMR